MLEEYDIDQMNPRLNPCTKELKTESNKSILDRRAVMKCPYCGSECIETEIAWGKSNETGNVGLKYAGFLGSIGVAQAYSDLCLECKTIIRTYIKEDTDKNWYHKPGTTGSK